MVTTLTLTSDFGGATGQQTGVFEFGENGPEHKERGAAVVRDTIRTGYLINNRGQLLFDALVQAVSDDTAFRKGVHIDPGSGQHVFEMDFSVPQDRTDSNGNTYQWGSSTSTTTVNQHTATAGTPEQQMYVLMNYIRQGTHDSRTPAQFEWAEYSSGGLEGAAVDVAIESPVMAMSNDAPDWADGTLTLVETADIQQAIDNTFKRP